MEYKDNNLPSTDMMRNEIEAIRSHNIENKINEDLTRYTELFTRWKNENDLSKEEISEMTSLGQKLESIKNQLN